MPVAVSHNNQWKRAVVVVISDSDVFVHFIDEGTKTYVKANRLRYLEKTFAEHPRMCYKGSLFGVNPKNGEKLWSGDAMKFMSKLNGRKMFASIKNLQNDFFQLLLVKDVFKQEQLSDHVIRAGLADLATNSVRFKNGVLEG